MIPWNPEPAPHHRLHVPAGRGSGRCSSTGSAGQAEQSGVVPVAIFAAFLRQDFDAVTAGLILEWSSGIVGGHVNWVKTVKATMCGRASFRLVRIESSSGSEPPCPSISRQS